MFKLYINNALLTKNSYDNADFSRIVRRLSEIENIKDIWIDFDMKPVDKDEMLITFSDKNEVKSTILALLDEIDLQLNAITWLLEEMSWNDRFCQKQKTRENNLHYFNYVIMEFLENSLKILKEE